MKLSYPEKSVSTDKTLILENQESHRIELSILMNEDETYSLIGISGYQGSHQFKQKAQGPYHQRNQAIGARTAITQSLLSSGYQIKNNSSLWTLNAQRLIRELRKMRTEHTGDYEFSPDDVLRGL